MSEDLLPLIARGERAAVSECIRRYGPLVLGLSRRVLGSGNEAEDAVQEIMIELWRNAARFDPSRAKERTFVVMIARRRLIDRRRARRAPVESLDAVDPDRLPTLLDTPFDESSDAIKAARAIDTLSEDKKKVLKLSVVEGLSHDEISERTGMPLGTVKSHLRRALTSIREKMIAPRATGRAMT